MSTHPATWRLTRIEEHLTRREIVSPEGVPLDFHIAPPAERLAALLVDLGLIVASVLLLELVIGTLGDELATALGLLALFLVWSFWFTIFELRWQGRTPGKRLLGLRVISSSGAPLSAGSVFVRNATREVELVLPTLALLMPEQVLPGDGSLLTLPCWNRDRLRLGDMIAGTLVVRAPRVRLLDELARVKASSAAETAVLFTPAQLGSYGVHELQVLEDLLRHPQRNLEGLATVARAIRAKVAWTPGAGPMPDDLLFLRAFYAAQRARLEHELLLGRVPRDKHEAETRRKPS